VQLEELSVLVEDREDEGIMDVPPDVSGHIIVRLFNDLADGLSLAPHLHRVHLTLRDPFGFGNMASQEVFALDADADWGRLTGLEITYLKPPVDVEP
jgi:hypothetical protein